MDNELDLNILKTLLTNRKYALEFVHESNEKLFVADLWRFAKEVIDLGFYISFSGSITYKPKPEICDYQKVVFETPLNMILTDTDCPYVAPMPYRGKRNEPVHVREIVKKIAEIKGLPEQDVAEAIVLNARRLFGI